MTSTKLKMAAVLLTSTALIAGCGKKKVEVLPPVAEGTDYGNGQTDPNAGGGRVMPGSQEDFLATVGQYGDRIFFDTDRFNVDTEEDRKSVV